MKKTVLLIAAVLSTMLLQAKNHTIVINGYHPTPKGHTEVAVDPTGNGDIITITPAIDVTTITVTIKDEYGEIVAEDDVPATTEGVYEVTTPETSEGSTIEVSDDNGVVYSDFE